MSPAVALSATLTASGALSESRTVGTAGSLSGAPVRPSVSRPARIVLTLVADGHADELIAVRLGVDAADVKRLVGELMTALDAWSKPALVAAGFNAGWLTRRPFAAARDLPERDVRVLALVASGWTDARIAAEAELGLSFEGVGSLLGRLRTVLRAPRGRVHLVRRAIDAGVLPIPGRGEFEAFGAPRA